MGVQRLGANKAEQIATEVRALEGLDLKGLRHEWRTRYGEPPTMRSTELLARLLAWRIQADSFGGLDASTVRLLKSERLPPVPLQLVPGTRLMREYHGQRLEVFVLEDGFRYAGTDYRSLSEIARTITGPSVRNLYAQVYGRRIGAIFQQSGRTAGGL